MLVYALPLGWSLASQFWSYTPPQKVSFPAAKKMKFPYWKLFSWSKICFWIFWRFLSLRRKNCHAVLDSRDDRGLPPESRLIRPHPIDCDRGPKQRVNIFPVFGFELCQKKCFQMVPTLVLIYTPKEAHSQIFVTGGSVIAWQMLANFFSVLGQASL